MNKIKLLLYIFLTFSFGAFADQEAASAFKFKLLSSQSQNIKLAVIGDNAVNINSFLPDAKKSLVIYRTLPIKSSGELIINFESNKPLGDSKLHKITAYKLMPLTSRYSTAEPFFTFINSYTEILEKRYPYRFVTKKRSCMNQQNKFFQCLYNGKAAWNTHFFVNNGEISLTLLPIVNEVDYQLIGSAIMISYTVGTGKRLDWMA